MGSINAALFETNPTILSAGVSALVKSLGELNSWRAYDSEKLLLSGLKWDGVQLLFIVFREPANLQIDLIKKLKLQFPRVRIIAIAPRATREILFSTIKCGASGILAADTKVEELNEAVLTVMNGHEYFSTSITQLLMAGYIENLRSGTGEKLNEIQKLGKRELEILSLWGGGNSNAEIAEKLFISVRTVESHKTHIMQKLNVRTTVDLLKFALRNNIISI